MFGEILMSSQKISNLAYVANDSDAASVKYVKDHASSHL